MSTTTLKNGQGVYPHYDALWHLNAIGVRVGNDTGAWDSANEERIKEGWTPVKVALIDTSVAWEHPNLEGVVDTGLMIDFFAARLGAFPGHTNQAALQPEDLPGADYAAQLAGIAGPETQQLLQELQQRLLTPTEAQSRVQPATSPAFSAHGTAMVGLIGARPASFKSAAPEFLGDISPLTPNGVPEPVQDFISDLPTVLPYAGVNPFCSVVPISTNLELDPEQMVLAMLYAALVSADVIALPRDIADPTRFRLSAGTGLPGDDEVALMQAIHPVGFDERQQRLWDELSVLLVELSKRIPIVAASGNGSDDRVIYPASVSADDNGVISVGAQAATGHASGYSPDKRFVDVFAPSGDGERLDEDVRRLDTLSTDYRAEEHSSDYVNELSTNVSEPVTPSTYAIQELISTDVPGRFGYNGSEFIPNDEYVDDDGIPDFGSYFCSFSGTSGAVGVAAGFLSLAFSAGLLPRGADDAGTRARLLMRQASDADANTAHPMDSPAAGLVSAIHWSRII